MMLSMSRFVPEHVPLGHWLDEPAPFLLQPGTSPVVVLTLIWRSQMPLLAEVLDANRSSSTPRSIRYDRRPGRSTSICSSGGGWIL